MRVVERSNGDRGHALDVVIEGDRIAGLEPPPAMDGDAVSAEGLFLPLASSTATIHLFCRSEDGDPGALARLPDPDQHAYAAAAARRTVLAGVTSAREEA